MVKNSAVESAKMNLSIYSLTILVTVATVSCDSVSHQVDINEQELQSNQVVDESVKVSRPDTRPLGPPPGQWPQGVPTPQSASGSEIGFGNLVTFRRSGPWQDIGLDVLGGLIQVTVNRAPGNRNVAVRIGNREINVG